MIQSKLISRNFCAISGEQFVGGAYASRVFSRSRRLFSSGAGGNSRRRERSIHPLAGSQKPALHSSLLLVSKNLRLPQGVEMLEAEK